MSQGARRKATIDDFWAIPEGERFHEFRASEQEIVEKAEPTGEHGDAQAGIVGIVRPPFDP
jgi:hypothetical protein